MKVYKLSHYVIFTDPFEVDTHGLKKQIAFATRSAEALVLPSHLCQHLMNENWEALSEETLQQLIEKKFVVDAEENELDTIVGENKANIDDDTCLYFVIQPTAFCQLGCDYCGQEHKKHEISSSNADNILARIRSKYIPGFHRSLRIGWFGGEPLVGLRQIREMTPRLKAFADELGIRYSAKIVTNGLSLKENIFLELVDTLYIKHIEVTLDGIAAFHDQRRHTKQAEPTFDIIFNNLKKIIHRDDFLEKGCNLSIRCNVDERNFDGVSPLIKLLAENGFPEKISYFYPIGVYSWGNDAHKKSLTKEEFAEREIDWLMEMFEAGFKPNLLPGRVKSVCLTVSHTSEMFDAFGNVFNCTEVSYVPHYEGSRYVLGNLQLPHDTISKERPLSNWNDQVKNNEFPCSSCKMLPVCGGACPKSWNEGMRACPSNKFNIREKLLLAYLSTKDDFVKLLKESSEDVLEHSC